MSVLNASNSKEKIKKIKKYCDEKLKKEIDLTFLDENDYTNDDIIIAKKQLKRSLRIKAEQLGLGELQQKVEKIIIAIKEIKPGKDVLPDSMQEYVNSKSEMDPFFLKNIASIKKESRIMFVLKDSKKVKEEIALAALTNSSSSGADFLKKGLKNALQKKASLKKKLTMQKSQSNVQQIKSPNLIFGRSL